MIKCLLKQARWTAFALVLGFSGTRSDAGFYSIVFDGPASVATNTPISVDVYLVETLALGEPTLLGDSDVGIITGNFRVEVVSGTSSLTSIQGNPNFDNYGGSVMAAPWIVNQADLDILNGTPTGTSIAPNLYRFQLGTIHVLSSSSSETTLLRIVDAYTGDAEDIVLGDGTPLDAVLLPSASFSLQVGAGAVVPEPSACVILGGLIAGEFGRRLRRIRTSRLIL
jgi:hypothetical protein